MRGGSTLVCSSSLGHERGPQIKLSKFNYTHVMSHSKIAIKTCLLVNIQPCQEVRGTELNGKRDGRREDDAGEESSTVRTTGVVGSDSLRTLPSFALPSSPFFGPPSVSGADQSLYVW